jgi:hypothetical protein
MKALTLHQPWASLIADKRKPEETRSRPWYYVGLVAIHAGQHVDEEYCTKFGYDAATIPRGAVVCIVNKYGCVQFPSPLASPNPYGLFDAGRYGYLLKDVFKLSEPIPARGAQGFWNWDENLLDPACRAQLKLYTYTQCKLPNFSIG